MPGRVLAFLAIAACVAGTAPLAPVSAAGTLALVGGRVYTSPDAAPLDDGIVLVEGGRIAAVGRRDRVKVPAGATTIDCRGLVVTAGFQNSHVHFTEPHWNGAAAQPSKALTHRLESMLTRYGFTTVVDTASMPANTLALRQRTEAGEVAGPRILTAGIALYPPDGIPYYVRDAVPPEVLALIPQATSGPEAAHLVRRNLDAGADVVKLFTGSWVTPERVLPMPQDVASGAVQEAHRRGKLVFAHPSDVAGLDVALRAGVDVLAHAVDDTSGLTVAHLQRLKRQDVALVPTLGLIAGRRARPEVLAQVRDYARLGGQILFGTDVGYLTDYDPGREYELMASAGLDWREVLASLTTSPAARSGESARRGRLAPGLDADLVVLGSDPAGSVLAFRDVRTTIRAGRVIYSRPPSP